MFQYYTFQKVIPYLYLNSDRREYTGTEEYLF